MGILLPIIPIPTVGLRVSSNIGLLRASLESLRALPLKGSLLFSELSYTRLVPE